MTIDPRLLAYYERELAYLRNAGQEFAQQHPIVARRLELSADESPDPHVERLLEGFAFLAARLHQHIDDSASDVAVRLLEHLFPHAARPVPAATIVRFEPDPKKLNLAAGYTVSRGRALFSESSAGDTVYLRTAYPVTLWPLRIASVVLETEAAGGLAAFERAASVLRVKLAYPKGFAFPAGQAPTLRFYLKGASEAAAELCDLLLANAIGVGWRPDGGADEAAQLLDGVRPRIVGLEPDESLLPERADTHPGLRLLLEYFAFPAKFQFVDLDCGALSFLAKSEGGPGAEAEGELLFAFERKPGRPLLMEAVTLELWCTPAVNLFARSTEPLRIDGRQAAYRLVADHHRQRSTEIYSVDRVWSSTPGALREELPAYFSFDAACRAPLRNGPFWHAQRVDGGRQGGTDIQLSFVDPGFAPAREAAARTLYAQVTCTNRQLAAQLDAGAILHIEDSGPIGRIVALHKPTAQVQPALDGSARWRLASLLALNQMSLADGKHALPSLRAMLALNNLTQSRAAAQQIMRLASLRTQRVLRHVGDDPWHGYRRGYSVAVQLDDGPAYGGSRMLFCAVLQRFLAMYAGVNTFVELVLEDAARQPLHTWNPLVTRHVDL
jgi:type VI secretion system protein ImpG